MSLSSWDEFAAGLPAAVRTAVAAFTSASVSTRGDGDDLPPAALSWVARRPPVRHEPRYACVESDNGEFAKLRVFRSADALARYLAAAEGRDTVVWCFYGVPLRFTQGPTRYLFLPDGRTALTIPSSPDQPAIPVPADSVTTPIQDDGFLGPPYLAAAPSTG